MAMTKLIAHGFLGYELVIDGSVQTHVLFGLVDEQNKLIAWYGFREFPSRWHELQYDLYAMDDTKHRDYKKPTANTRFAGTDFTGHQLTYPGQLSVAGLVSRNGNEVQASLDLNDRSTRATHCILSVPSVRPVGVNLTFGLVPKRKRYTIDHKMNGSIALIVVEKYTPNSLVIGPNPAVLGAYRVPSESATRK